jgi:branched-subunit amino acid transport protein AzlD
MYSYLLIGVMALVTIAIRFLPFIIFRKRTPDLIVYLGRTLPYCAMAMLVVYCLRNCGFEQLSDFLPELLAVLVVVITYKWKKNSSLSIVISTLFYMLMVQFVFV